MPPLHGTRKHRLDQQAAALVDQIRVVEDRLVGTSLEDDLRAQYTEHLKDLRLRLVGVREERARLTPGTFDSLTVTGGAS